MYHISATAATMLRVLRQLSHDHRTVALIFLVPCILLGLLRWMYNDELPIFNQIAPALLGIFPFIIMFLITSITTLRERTDGTMERLMSLPIGKFDLVLGYMFAFGIMAIIQACLASFVLLYALGLDVAGPHWFLVIMALVDALLGTAFGIFVSAFASTEFQAVQFMPALILPQLLIGGLLLPLDKLPGVLDVIAHCLPLTYAIEALNEIVHHTGITDTARGDIWTVVAFMIAALLLAAVTLRRRTK